MTAHKLVRHGRIPVLLLSPSAKPGGAERALVSLATRLPEAGFAPRAVLLEGGPVERWFIDEGVDVSVVPAGRARHVRTLARTVWRLRSMIRESRTEAVVSNMAKGHMYGSLAAASARVPSVWWQQGIPERSGFDMVAAKLPAAAVVASCEKAVQAQRKLTPNRRVVRLHLGLDVDRIAARRGSGSAVRSRLGWDQNPIVGIVGRLEPWKGQEIFLRAAALVLASFPAVRFLVVGGAVLGWEGDYPERLVDVAHTLGLGDRVHFTGHQADVYPWFDALDIAVHASIGEPFGLVLVEAMALGKPLVATADGGPLEIVEDLVSGLLVPPEDVGALAGAIEQILADAPLARRLAEGGVARAQYFSEKRMAAGMADILADVLLRRSDGTAKASR